MTIAMALDEEPYRQARHCKNHEQAQALEALRRGEPQDLTLKHRTTQITWTARPVTFLPLAHPRQNAASMRTDALNHAG